MDILTDTKVKYAIANHHAGTFLRNEARVRARAKMLSAIILRYGLALVILWIGAMKFTDYEASGIQPLVANSPLMGWLYGFLSVQMLSNLLGVVEIAIAGMIAARRVSPDVSALGSLLAVLMFFTTVTFLFSTPGWEPSLGGFPALAVVPGQFLLKDIVLLGAALWCLADSLETRQPR